MALLSAALAKLGRESQGHCIVRQGTHRKPTQGIAKEWRVRAVRWSSEAEPSSGTAVRRIASAGESVCTNRLDSKGEEFNAKQRRRQAMNSGGKQ